VTSQSDVCRMSLTLVWIRTGIVWPWRYCVTCAECLWHASEFGLESCGR